MTAQAFWLMFAKTAGFAMSIALPMVLVRIFNPYHFGLYKQAFSLVATIYAMVNLGVGISAFYFFARDAQRRPQAALNILVYNFCAGFLILLFFVWWPGSLALVFGAGDMRQFAVLIGTLILLTLFSSFLEMVATAMQDVALSTIFIVFAQASKVVFITGAALAFSTVQSVLWAAIAQALVQTALLMWYLRRRFGSFWNSFDRRFFLEQVSYAIPYGLGGLLYTAQTDLHLYFVAHAFGPARFALYAVGCMQVPLLGLWRESIQAVMISRLSEWQQEGRVREMLLLTARAMRKTAFIYFPAFALLMVVGRDLIVLLYTKNYEGSWPIFAVNLLTLPMLVLITDPTLRAFAAQRYFVMYVRVVLLALGIPALLWLLPRYGMAAAVGTVVGMAAIERIVTTWKTASLLGMRRQDVRLFAGVGTVALVSAIAGLGALLIRWLVSHQHPAVVLLACSAGFAAVFAGCVGMFGVLEAEEREMVGRQVARVLRVCGVRGAGRAA